MSNSNIFTRLKALFSSPPKLVGTVLSITGGYYQVQLKGGTGLIRATATAQYQVGDSVYIQGTVISGKAPNVGTVVTIEV